MKKKFVLVVNNFNNIIIKLNLNVQHLNDKIKSNKNSLIHFQFIQYLDYPMKLMN